MRTIYLTCTLLRVLVALPILLGADASTLLHAQAGPESRLMDDEIHEHKKQLLADITQVMGTGADRVAAIQSLLDVRSRTPLFSLSLANAGMQAAGNAVLSTENLRRELEATRMDKELGAGASASGGTSLIEKGGIPKVLSFAVENGALTKAQSGTTITFRGKPGRNYQSAQRVSGRTGIRLWRTANTGACYGSTNKVRVWPFV